MDVIDVDGGDDEHTMVTMMTTGKTKNSVFKEEENLRALKEQCFSKHLSDKIIP